MYEVNLRQYTPGGSIREFREHLARLRDLGTGILWFMPIYPVGGKCRKGSLGSYYSIRDYRAVNPEFGTLDEFRSLVAEAHGMGMKVILDWVANHTAWDHRWTDEHPEFYHRDENGGFKAPNPDWEDVIHLDYGNPGLWDAMIADMVFWIEETGVDGFRCDMAHLVPTLFWNHARRELDTVKPVFMLAESENHDLLEYAFDTIYNWKLLHGMNDLAAGRKNARELAALVYNELDHLPPGASLLNFTSNHDENSWQGSAIERLHYFLEPLTVLTFLLPGIPLVYSGQEAGNYKRIKFFDKDEIEWKEDKMAHLYAKLSGVARSLAAEGGNAVIERIENDAEESVMSWQLAVGRRQVLVFLNLSGTRRSFQIECKNYEHLWFNSVDGTRHEVDCKNPLGLNPYSHLILSNFE